ncbi:MAG TPA: spore cortex-lytic enzyme [Oscillospiraceae bacterium]|nr:spore cortex-lytic enzyme [Oscillospiraceae bacterium]
MKISVDKSKLKKAWSIFVIILLNILIVAIVVSVAANSMSTESSQVLSKLGSRGDEVRNVQNALKKLGLYNGAVDGIYGTKTASAVKQFQRNCGITVDGIAGPKTLLYLGLGGSPSSANQSDLYLLAKVIAAEGRGESYTGQVAIGAVVLNRIKHPSFPDSVSGVVYQEGAFTCVRDRNWSTEPNATSRKAAQDALNGWDPSGGSIYYYNPSKTSNKWMRTRPVVVTIGSHVFCK